MALLHLWLARFPDKMAEPHKMLATWGWVVVLGTCLIQVTARGYVIAAKDPHPSLCPARPWRWRAVVIIAVATWILVSTPAPLYIAVLISRPWMSSMAREILAGQPRVDYPPRWVGLWQADYVYTTTDEVGFTVANPLPGSNTLHFAHRDEWPAGKLPAGEYRSLGGGWRLFKFGGHARSMAQHDLAAALEARGEWSPGVLAIMIETLVNDSQQDQWYGHTRLEGGFRENYTPTRVVHDRSFRAGKPLRPDMRALLRAGDAAVPLLRQALVSHKDPAVRMRAATVLSLMGEDAAAAVPELTKALADPESLVRETAALALGMVGPPARPAAPTLGLALRDVNPWVRYNATLALRWIKPDPSTYMPSLQGELCARLGLPTATTRPVVDCSILVPPYGRSNDPRSVAYWETDCTVELLHLAADAGPASAPLGQALGTALLAPMKLVQVGAIHGKYQDAAENRLQLALLEAVSAAGPAAKDALPSLLQVLDDDGAIWGRNRSPGDEERLTREFATALARAIASVDPHNQHAAGFLAQRVESFWHPSPTAPSQQTTQRQAQQAARMLAVVDPGSRRTLDALAKLQMSAEAIAGDPPSGAAEQALTSARLAAISNDPAALSKAIRTGGYQDRPFRAQAMRQFAKCVTFDQLLGEVKWVLQSDLYPQSELVQAAVESLGPYADQPRARDMLMGFYLDSDSDVMRQLARRALHHPTTRPAD